MATIEEIRKAMAAQIKANVERGTNVTWYEILTDTPDFPRIGIELTEVGYFGTFGPDGESDVLGRLRLEIGVLPMTAENAAIKLSAYLDTTQPSSIVNAVMADKTLGGTVDECVVLSATVLSPYEAEFPFSIILSKQGANV